MYRPKHKIRIVTSAALFDGHDAAINIMRRILQSTGAEVIHLGHNRSVDEVVNCAIQEDVQGIALTSYQGGHLEYFKYMYDLLQEKGASHIKIFGGGGGVILPREIEELKAHGIAQIYSPDDGRRMGLQGMIDDMLKQCDFQTITQLNNDTRSIRNKNTKAIASAITMVENHPHESESFLKEIKKCIDKKKTPVLGITGTGGAGKSSLIFSLASHFNYSIAIISFTPKMTDVNIMRALRSLEDNDDKDNNKIKKKYFIVFEDMDCIFKERKTNDEHKNMVTFSGILNALDGITTPENMISFITTNFKSNLDSALIRPGRVDKIITFDYAIKEQVIEMYKKYTCEFYESLDIDKKCDEFYEVLCNLNIKTSTSLLQQYLMCHLDNPEGAIKNIKEMKKMYEASKVNNFETAEAGLYN